jgi:hypothetical protein
MKASLAISAWCTEFPVSLVTCGTDAQCQKKWFSDVRNGKLIPVFSSPAEIA